MMVAIYEPSSINVAIKRILYAPEDMLDHNINSVEKYVEVDGIVRDTTHYVDLSGAPTVRVKNSFDIKKQKVDDSTTKFTNIPVGTEVRINQEKHTVNDGELEVTSTLPGSYVIWFSHTVYLEESHTFEVNS